MFGIANCIAGGPIYDCNKKMYLEEHGWNVVVVPVSAGKVLLTPLKEYEGISFPFVTASPSSFTKKKLHVKIEELVSYVNVGTSEETIIETGTDYTALWGELLAERLNAKHIIMFLDETNRNVNDNTYKFYEFKYKRGELASISLESLNAIFSPYFELSNPEQHVLSAWCRNSVGDNDFELEKHIPTGDFVIGSIGRLEKGFVPNIIQGICQFAQKVPNQKVSVCFIGGSDRKTEEKVRNGFASIKNISLYITGYLWPIPRNLFTRFDLFISGAGSVYVSANMGIATVRMDVITYEPLGFVKSLNPENMETQNLKNGTVEDYIWKALIEKDTPKITDRIPLEKEWEYISASFDKHMKFIENSANTKEYYPTNVMPPPTHKEKIKKTAIRILGYETYYKLLTGIKRTKP